MAAEAEPAREFYDWSFKRYQRKMRRAIVLLVALVVVALAAVGALAVAISSEHEDILGSQGIEHAHETEEEIMALRDEIQDLQAQNVKTMEHLRTLILCINRKTDQLDAGLKRLLRADISTNRYLNDFQLPRCS
jgi:methyl-accepting chemotaxis protein